MTDIAPQRCECGYEFDVATAVSGALGTPRDARPTPGCVVLCLRCGRAQTFDKDMRLAPFDLDSLDAQARAEIRSLQAQIARLYPDRIGVGRPLGKAETPCMGCGHSIAVAIRSMNEFELAMRARGALWDRGWFCGLRCRAEFNARSPAVENDWDRVLRGIAQKPRGNG